MGSLIEITGRQFGRLTVVSRKGKDKHGRALWSCVCECGGNLDTVTNRLRNGETKSCGCLARETKATMHLIHGLAGTDIYQVWSNMMRRCYDANNKGFHNYGGRGIKVCSRWKNVLNFYEDMGERPKGLTIERIDNNKGYNPKNCKWASYKEQNNNKRNRKEIQRDLAKARGEA